MFFYKACDFACAMAFILGQRTVVTVRNRRLEITQLYFQKVVFTENKGELAAIPSEKGAQPVIVEHMPHGTDDGNVSPDQPVGIGSDVGIQTQLCG